jgi:putative N6-adenine-specific DNA methylase
LTTKPEIVMIAKTIEGLEEVLAEELRSIGGKEVEILKRGVKFTGDKTVLYKANYLCRTALRILMPVATFPAPDEQALYDQVFNMPWEQYMSVDETFAVDGVVNFSHLTHSHYAALKAKDAIADRFRSKYNRRPDVDTDYPSLRVNIHIFRDECSVALDSSGSSLHLRGYRNAVVTAPLNEVLAAGLVFLSGWNGKSPLLDPMCGSGTILIEAGMLALHIPPGYFRKHFGFQDWHDYDATLWEHVKKEAEGLITHDDPVIRGSDIDLRAVRIARENIKITGLDRIIRVEQKPFADTKPPAPEGMIIANPPYGQRIGVEDPVSFYKQVGDVLKNKFAGYRAWFLSGDLENLKFVGLRPSRRIKIFNGPLECRFARFDIYAGSKKSPHEPGVTPEEAIF